MLVTRIESQFASVGIEERRMQTPTIQPAIDGEMESNLMMDQINNFVKKNLLCEQSKVGEHL